MAHEYAVAFSIAGKISGEFKKSFSVASRCMEDCNKALQKLNAQAGQVDKLMKNRTETAKLANQYRQAQNQFREYINAQRAAGKVADVNSKEYQKLSKSVDKTRIAYERAKKSMQEYAKTSVFGGMNNVTLEKKRELIGDRIASKQKWLNVKDSFTENSAAFMAAGQAAKSFLSGIIETGAKFEHQMTRVAAVSRATPQELEELTKAARRAGASTEWMASQAGQALEIMAQGGFNYKEQIAGLTPTLNLATASSVDLSTAGGLIVNMVRSWGKEAQWATHAANVMADAQRRADVNVVNFGEAMKYVAPVARKAGASFEFVSAAIAKVGDQGIKGSQAGTALKAIIQRTAGTGRKAIEGLGVQVVDANKNLRAMDDIFRDIEKHTASWGNAQKTAFLQKAFGAEAAGVAAILMESSAKLKGGVSELADSFRNVDGGEGKIGVAAQMAAQQSETTIGRYKTMMSKWENFQIETFTKLAPMLQPIMDTMSVILGKAAEFMAANPKIAQGIAIVVGALAALITVLGPVAIAIAICTTIGGALAAAFGAIGLTGGIVIGAILAIIAVGYLLIKNWDSVKDSALKGWTIIKEAVIKAINLIIDGINRLIQGMNSLGNVKVPDWVPGIGGKTVGFNIPQIPKLAQGGIVSQPTMALIGEGKESEAVLPLSKLNSLLSSVQPQITINPAVQANLTQPQQTETLPLLDKLGKMVSGWMHPSVTNETVTNNRIENRTENTTVQRPFDVGAIIKAITGIRFPEINLGSLKSLWDGTLGALFKNFRMPEFLGMPSFKMPDINMDAVSKVLGGFKLPEINLDGLKSIWDGTLGALFKNFKMPQLPDMAKVQVPVPQVPAPSFTMPQLESSPPEAIQQLNQTVQAKPVGSGEINLTFAPVIHVNGGDGDPYAQVKRGLDEGSRNLKEELERLMADQRRLSFV